MAGRMEGYVDNMSSILAQRAVIWNTLCMVWLMFSLGEVSWLIGDPGCRRDKLGPRQPDP